MIPYQFRLVAVFNFISQWDHSFLGILFPWLRVITEYVDAHRPDYSVTLPELVEQQQRTNEIGLSTCQQTLAILRYKLSQRI